MRQLIIIVGFLSIVSGFSYSAVLKGFVLEKDTNVPLLSANVGIYEARLGSSTDLDGFYYIDKIPSGIHIVKTSLIGYATKYDTIIVDSINQEIDIDFILSPGSDPIDTVTGIEDYHRYLGNYKPEDILEIRIDSINLDTKYNYRFRVYSTFRNNSDSSIYVIRDLVCMNMVDIIVTKIDGELVKPNFGLCCTGEKIDPDSSDFMEIPPHSSKNYFPITIDFFSRYPIDDYKIRLKYIYSRRNRLDFLDDLPEAALSRLNMAKYYYDMAFRGEVVSLNYIVFNNEEVVQ